MSGVEQRKISSEEEGMRLDRWFRSHYPDLPHGQLQKLLRTGQVRVDGGRVKAQARLEAGQTVRVPPLEATDRRARAVPQELSDEDRDFIQSLIVHSDDHVIALNKPAGLAVQGGTHTLRHIDGLLEGIRFGASERPRLVHRLDKETSGLLLIARSRRAASHLGDVMKRHRAQKTYWALVMGAPRQPQGSIDLALVKRGGPGAERMHIVDQVEGADITKAQKALTHYTLIEHAGQRLAWLAMMPVTGRTHQLRAHAAAIGHGIVGDWKYAGKDAHPGGEISDKLHLHARLLSFPHPAGGTLELEAPLPEHMQKSWDLLGFESKITGGYLD